MAYADDITITSTHTSTSAAKKYIQPYLHKVFAWTKPLPLCSHQTLRNIRAIWTDSSQIWYTINIHNNLFAQRCSESSCICSPPRICIFASLLHLVFRLRRFLQISLKDRRTNEELRRLVEIEPITTFIRSGRLR